MAAWKRVAAALPQELQGYAREWGEAVEGLYRGTVSAHLEWELWRSLCEALEESGAVTKADLKSPISRNDTSGQRLLKSLRAWGDARAAIARAEREPK